jgi:hypothetical protein
MKTPKRLAAVFGTLALGSFSILGGAVAAPSAQAQTRPATSSVFNICSYLATNLECIISNGPGAQVDIAGQDFAVFTKVYTSPDDGDWEIQNAGGNCLRAFADGTVGLANGACDHTVSAEFWKVQTASDGRTTYESEKYPNEYMGADGDEGTLPVYIGPPESGFFTGWVNV